MTDIPDTNETVIERLWREVIEVHAPPSRPESVNSLRSNLVSMEGQENDPLIPTQELMNSTWDQAEATWQSYVAKSSEWPVGFFNPFILLSAIPSLPDRISDTLWGKPVWAVPNPAGGVMSVNGRRTEFALSQSPPCTISYRTQHKPGEIPASMTVLTLCWSYILSVNLLERQGSRAMYTATHIRPSSTPPELDGDGARNLQLPKGASVSLISWICALVTPGMGWISDGRNDYPIWALACPESPAIRVSIASVPRFDQSSCQSDLESRPGPTFREAVKLFLELCCICDLDKEMSSTSIPAIEASFMAALAIPYQRSTNAKVELPLPYLRNGSTSVDHETPQALSVHCKVVDYCKHLGYFMALSTHCTLYRSMLWTVFWQPGIPCNLVSSWFGGIQSTLRPMLDQRDFGKLLRTFAARRPRVTLMWLGVFLLNGGHQAQFDTFDAYLQGFGATCHDFVWLKSTFEMGPWTGSVQSFWDYELDEAGLYTKNVEEPLAPGFHHRSEVMQRRYNANLSERGTFPDPWEPPLSPMSAADIEPELDMGGNVYRRYLCFAWPQFKTLSGGFCYHNGYHHQLNAPPDNFNLVAPQTRQDGNESEARRDRRTFLGPSKRATAYWIAGAVVGVSGKSNYNVIKDFEDHPWVPDWLIWHKEKAEERGRADATCNACALSKMTDHPGV